MLYEPAYRQFSVNPDLSGLNLLNRLILNGRLELISAIPECAIGNFTVFLGLAGR